MSGAVTFKRGRWRDRWDAYLRGKRIAEVEKLSTGWWRATTWGYPVRVEVRAKTRKQAVVCVLAALEAAS